MKKVTCFILPFITALFVLCVYFLVSNGYQAKQAVSLLDVPSHDSHFSADSPITPEGKININTASAKELTLLSGIGDVLSQRIVAYREEHGPYSQVEDLLNVKGIGEVKLSNIIDYIAVE